MSFRIKLINLVLKHHFLLFHKLTQHPTDPNPDPDPDPKELNKIKVKERKERLF